MWLAEKASPLAVIQVAIKIAHDVESIEAIRREAVHWHRASGHPNVLGFIDADLYDNQPVLVLEFAPGGSLGDRLRQGPISPSDALKIIRGVLQGLQHLHSNEIVHRDITPRNILFKDGVPKIADFGLSRIVSHDPTSSHVAGTLDYMAPEALLRGARTRKTDLWSVGVVLYEMLYGSRPFDGVGKILDAAPVQLSASLQPGLQKVLKGALAKAEASRFSTAAEMLDAVNAVDEAEGIRPAVDPNAATVEMNPKPAPLEVYSPPKYTLSDYMREYPNQGGFVVGEIIAETLGWLWSKLTGGK